MKWDVTADPRKFDEAAKWFRSRMPVTKTVADRLAAYSGPRAFTMAGVAQLSVVQHAFDSLAKAIEKGTPFETWQSGIEAELTAAWGRKNSARMLLIFRNATSQAHNAGRWIQINDPAVAAIRTFLLFDGVDDSRQTPFCRSWSGTIRLRTDPCWQHAHPQCHHGCRSILRSLTAAAAKARGITKTLPEEEAAKGFGKPPTESEWHPDPAKHWKRVFDEYRAKRTELSKRTKRHRLDE